MKTGRVADKDLSFIRESKATKESTGFEDPSGIVISYDKLTRKITVTHPSGKIFYLFRGTRMYLNSPWVSDAHDDVVENDYFLYTSDGTNFVWTTTPWNFYDVMVSLVYYGTADKFALRECHGMTIPWMVHQAFHLNFGTYRKSGLELTAGTYEEKPAAPTDAKNTFGIDAGVVVDDDLETTINALTEGSYTLLKFTGSGTPVFSTGALLPFIYSGGNIIQYNRYLNGTFSDVEVSNNSFANLYVIYLPVASDADSQKYRMLVMQGQREYASADAARNEDPKTLNFGTLVNMLPEYTFYIRVTMGRASSYTTTGKCRIEQTDKVLGTRVAPVVAANILSSLDAELVRYTNTIEGLNITNAKAALDLLISRLFDDSQYISASLNPAVPFTHYYANSASAPIVLTLPNVSAGDKNMYMVSLAAGSNTVTVTTVGGTQLIGGATSQVLSNLSEQMYFKANGTDGYDIFIDTRDPASAASGVTIVNEVQALQTTNQYLLGVRENTAEIHEIEVEILNATVRLSGEFKVKFVSGAVEMVKSEVICDSEVFGEITFSTDGSNNMHINIPMASITTAKIKIVDKEFVSFAS